MIVIHARSYPFIVYFRYKKHLAAKDISSKTDSEKMAIFGGSFVQLDFSETMNSFTEEVVQYSSTTKRRKKQLSE